MPSMPDWLAIGLQAMGVGLFLVGLMIWIDVWLHSRHVRRLLRRK